MRRRFFVPQFHGSATIVEGDTAHHLGRVLRAQPGQLYELSDGEQLWLGRIERVSRDQVEFALIEPLPAHIPTLRVTLLLSVVKFDAFEWAIEKATELGVDTIVPLAAARSEKALLAAAPKRAERWRKVLAEASQQSRRMRVPVLAPLATPEQAFRAQAPGAQIILSEQPAVRALREVLAGETSGAAALAFGPEGGWTPDEFAAARAAGYREASLGHLILRTETAVIAALASLHFALGQ